jgi:hypothetical protein
MAQILGEDRRRTDRSMQPSFPKPLTAGDPQHVDPEEQGASVAEFVWNRLQSDPAFDKLDLQFGPSP